MRKAKWAGAVAACLAAVTAQAGRPLSIDDADPVEVQQFEFEGGAGYYRDSSCRHWDFPFGLAYGVVRDVELGIGFGGQFEKRAEMLGGVRGPHKHESGVSDLNLGAKWRFLDESAWCPRQALAPAVKFPTADENDGLGSGKIDYDLTWIASKALTDRMGMHVNVGYSWISSPKGEDVGDVVHYGVALDYQLTDTLQGVGEVFAENEIGNGGETAVLHNLGLRWNLSDAVILDLAAGSRICGDGTPDFTATAGVTWAFGFTDGEK